MDQNTKDVLTLALPLVGSVATGLISAYVAVKMAELKVQVQDVAKAVNGRMTDLIDSAKLVGRGEGRHEGRMMAREEVREDIELKVATEGAPPGSVVAQVLVPETPKGGNPHSTGGIVAKIVVPK